MSVRVQGTHEITAGEAVRISILANHLITVVRAPVELRVGRAAGAEEATESKRETGNYPVHGIHLQVARAEHNLSLQIPYFNHNLVVASAYEPRLWRLTMGKYLLATILLAGVAMPAAAQSPNDALTARTRAYQAALKPVRAAALVEWVAANCTGGLDAARIREAAALLTSTEHQDTVTMLRKVNAERARLYRTENTDPCASFLAELGN